MRDNARKKRCVHHTPIACFRNTKITKKHNKRQLVVCVDVDVYHVPAPMVPCVCVVQCRTFVELLRQRRDLYLLESTCVVQEQCRHLLFFVVLLEQLARKLMWQLVVVFWNSVWNEQRRRGKKQDTWTQISTAWFFKFQDYGVRVLKRTEFVSFAMWAKTHF